MLVKAGALHPFIPLEPSGVSFLKPVSWNGL